MVTIAVDKIVLELESKLKKVDRIDKFNKKLDKAGLKMDKTGKIIDKTTGKFNNFDQANKKLQKVEKSTGKMNMKMLGFGLSMLFTGMAIKRLASTILRSLKNAFMLLADETSAGVKRVLSLQAALQFLKFILFDTFANTEMFANFVEFVVNVLNFIGEIVQNNPKIVELGALLLGLTVIFATLMMVIGQTTLAMIGLSAIGLGVGAVFGIMGIILLLIIGLFLLLTSNLHPLIKLFGVLALVILSIQGILLLIEFTLTGFGLVFLITLGVLIGAFILMRNHLGSSKLAFKAFGIFLLAVLAAIGDAMMEAIILPLRLVIATINLAIRASNKFLGTDFSLIDQPKFAPLSKAVFEMRNNLLAEGAEITETREEEKSTNLSIDTIKNLGTVFKDGMAEALNENKDLMPSTDL